VTDAKQGRDERDWPLPSTGSRREEPARCYICGREKLDAPSFGDPTCGKPKCREQWAKLQR